MHPGRLWLLVSCWMLAVFSSTAVDEGQKDVFGVGVYVYKSVEPFSKYINPPTHSRVTRFIGANYHVHSSSGAFTKARATIILPSKMNLSGTIPRSQTYLPRIPRISLSLVLENLALDVGVEYRNFTSDEQGWFASYEGLPRANWECFPGAATVNVTLEVKSSTKDGGTAGVMTASFTFADDQGGLVTGTKQTLGTTMLTLQSFTLPASLRWGRSMSFLPFNGSQSLEQNRNDLTFMKGASFTGLQLWSAQTGNWVAWDLQLTDYAWSVETGNIVALEIASAEQDSTVDKFAVLQQVWYPYHCVVVDNKCRPTTSNAKYFTLASAINDTSTGLLLTRSHGWYKSPRKTILTFQCWDQTVTAFYIRFARNEFAQYGDSSRWCMRSYAAKANFSITSYANGTFMDTEANVSAQSCKGLGGTGDESYSIQVFHRYDFPSMNREDTYRSYRIHLFPNVDDKLC